jgi:hypothetical protein
MAHGAWRSVSLALRLYQLAAVQPRCQGLCWLPGMLVLALSSGCGTNGSSADTSNEQTTTIADADPAVYDAGEVIIGQTVSHRFGFRNAESVPLAIRADEDVHKNCGCSSLAPEARQLKPGAETYVAVSVQTKGLSGRFTKGGSITWRASDDFSRVFQVMIRGKAVPALRAAPDSLRFEAEDTRIGVEKQVTITAAIPIDWSTFTAGSTSPYLEVTRVTKGPSAAVCSVRCKLPDGIEARAADLRITARVAGTASALAGETVALTVPMILRRQTELDFLPKTVPIAFRRDQCGTARLMLRGESVAREPVFKSIRCDGYEVQWALKKGGNRTAILELVCRPARPGARPVSDLRIDMVDGQTVCLPTIHVPSR